MDENPGDRSKPRFSQLDSLRGLAAVSVALWHWINVWVPTYAPGEQSTIFRAAMAAHDPRILGRLGSATLLEISPLRVFFSGGEAVILFFLLSGFVLSLPFLNGGRVAYGGYLVKRLFRIYVPYLGALALAVLGNALLRPGNLPELSDWFNSTWPSAPEKSDILWNILLIGGYRDGVFNTAFWSLVHEMRISLVFPLVMAGMNRAGQKMMFLPLPVMVCGIWLGPRLAAGRLGESVEVLGFFLTGVCLAQFRGAILRGYSSLGSAARAGLFAVAAGLFSFGWIWTFPAHALGWSLGYKDLFVCLGAAGLIVTSLGSPMASALLGSACPLALGRVSYSLYLVHATILWGLVHEFYSQTSVPTIFFGYLVLLSAATPLFWRLIEEPSMRYGRHLARLASSSGRKTQGTGSFG